MTNYKKNKSSKVYCNRECQKIRKNPKIKDLNVSLITKKFGDFNCEKEKTISTLFFLLFQKHPRVSVMSSVNNKNHQQVEEFFRQEVRIIFYKQICPFLKYIFSSKDDFYKLISNESLHKSKLDKQYKTFVSFRYPIEPLLKELNLPFESSLSTNFLDVSFVFEGQVSITELEDYISKIS